MKLQMTQYDKWLRHNMLLNYVAIQYYEVLLHILAAKFASSLLIVILLFFF